MSNLSDLWEQLDNLNERKKQGENVDEEINRVKRQMDEIRTATEKKWGEQDEANLQKENEAAFNRQPGQHLPYKPRR